MDPISQGVLGAVAAQSLAPKSQQKQAALLGALSGMAPDLDVLIRSSQDPLLALEFHRQFTHSLLFIPLGALLCAVVFRFVFRFSLGFQKILCYAALGYATHALLDACTSYGTQLLWPISDHRFSWDTVAVVDPMVTLPLLLCAFAAGRMTQVGWARLGIVWVFFYIGILGSWQHGRAVSAGQAIALSRGHDQVLVSAKPTLGNLILWKSIYSDRDGTLFYVDAIHAGRTVTYLPGDRVPRLDLQRDFPWLAEETQQYADIGRFAWFSQDYLAVDPRAPNRIGDIRYSMLPSDIEPLWAVQLNPEASATAHVQFVTQRSVTAERFTAYRAQLAGVDFLTLPNAHDNAEGERSP